VILRLILGGGLFIFGGCGYFSEDGILAAGDLVFIDGEPTTTAEAVVIKVQDTSNMGFFLNVPEGAVGFDEQRFQSALFEGFFSLKDHGKILFDFSIIIYGRGRGKTSFFYK